MMTTRERSAYAVALGCAAVILLSMLTAVCQGDPIDATVRLRSGGTFSQACGTGTVFRVDQDGVLILTCRHVVGNSRSMQVEFWSHGWQADQAVTGKVVARGKRTDSAVIEVPRSALRALGANYLPPHVPLASGSLSKGDTILSVGCPNAVWPQLFRGHLVDTRIYSGGAQSLAFVPPPAGGRSGSAIFDATGEHIVGVLHSRDDQNGVGIADPIAAVAADLGVSGTTSTTLVGLDTTGWRASKPAQFSCPPGGCPQAEPDPNGERGWFGGWPGSGSGGIFGGGSGSGREGGDEPQRGGLFDRIRERRQDQLPQQPEAAGPQLSEQMAALEASIAALRAQASQSPAQDPELAKQMAALEMRMAGIQANMADKVTLAATAAGLQRATTDTAAEIKATTMQAADRTSSSLASKIKTVAVWGGGGLGALLLGGPLGIGIFILRKISSLIKKDIKDYRETGGANPTLLQHLAAKTPMAWDDVLAKLISDKLAAGESKVDQGIDALVAKLEGLIRQQPAAGTTK
jgi:hypothetical protein